MSTIILFDGICNLCNSSVQFIIQRDRAGYFQFASLQGEAGRKLERQFNLPLDIDSFILIENGQFYTKSTAALRVCKYLDGGWKLLALLRVVPRPIRDFVYDWIAKHRYRWFGKRDTCTFPTQEQQARFLD